MLPILAALLFSCSAGALVLWFAGFGGQGSAEATARLGRIRTTDGDFAQVPSPANEKKGGSRSFRMRRPNGVSLGGITLVSGRVSQNWAKQLERAGLTLNVREYLIMRIVVGVVAGLLAMLFTGFPLVFLLVFPIGYMIPAFFVKLRVGRRMKKMDAQLIEMLQMVASGLRAGFGLQQALEASAEQVPEPLSTELKRAMRDIAMGASVEQSLTSLNQRVASPDFDIVITAILIQRQVGGNLAEILDNVAHTMRERVRIRGEIQTLTSQQRMTGYVIGGIPVGLMAVFYLINREFIMLLFTEPLGRMMLLAVIIMEAIGGLIIRKIVNIEV